MCLGTKHDVVNYIPIVMRVKDFVFDFRKLIVTHQTAGWAGSAPIACGQGSIGDLFSERDRASAMALFTLGPLLGDQKTLINRLYILTFYCRSRHRSYCRGVHRADGRHQVGFYHNFK